MPPPGDGDTVEIIVQLTPEAIDPTTSVGVTVRVTAADAGAGIEVMHPGTDDAELATWARVVVPASRAEQLVTRLAASPGVAAAYVKSPGPAA
jgi:hypothetical protein